MRLIASLQPHESDPAALAHDLLLISRDLLLISRVLPQHLDGPGRADRPKRLRRLMAHLMTGNQRQSSEAIRGQKKQTEAIKFNERQSEAHHAVLMLAAHGVTERVDRPCVLELPEDEGDLVLEQRAPLLVAETRLTAAIRDSHSQSGNQR